MTLYEWLRWVTLPIMPVHLQTVNKHIKQLVLNTNINGERMQILDVGGRKSPYTIGVPATITLLDVPQESGVKEALNLGFTHDILESIKKKRSNIRDLIVEDMTQSTLNDNSFDAVVCVEVIEHVLEDDIFVKNIAKVIKKGGWVYFTTPNGDYIKNEGPDKNPDHVRHYSKTELFNLLEKYFSGVKVQYAVRTGKYRLWGLRSLKLRKPLRMMKTIIGNLVNSSESNDVENQSERTAHLIAIAYK